MGNSNRWIEAICFSCRKRLALYLPRQGVLNLSVVVYTVLTIDTFLAGQLVAEHSISYKYHVNIFRGVNDVVSLGHQQVRPFLCDFRKTLKISFTLAGKY
jgi:hypothetical protein